MLSQDILQRSVAICSRAIKRSAHAVDKCTFSASQRCYKAAAKPEKENQVMASALNDELKRKTEAMEKRVAEAEAAKKRAEDALSASGNKLAMKGKKAKMKAKGKKGKKGRGGGRGGGRGAGAKAVGGKSYERELMEMAASLASDGQISHPDAEKLWASASDGPGLTVKEKNTLEHLMEEYRFTDKAVAYMKEQIGLTPVVQGSAAETALVVKTKGAGGGLGAIRKKILDELGERSVEDALADAKGTLKTYEGMRDEAKAMADAHDKQEAAALKEFEVVKKEVESAVDAEAAAATKLRGLKDSKNTKNGGLSEGRLTLLEAQKKLAMIEVLALNHKRMQELESLRKSATEAAEQAKKNLQEQRQKEKDLLEATRKQLQDAKAAASGHGTKRAAEETKEAPAAKKAAADAGDIDRAALC